MAWLSGRIEAGDLRGFRLALPELALTTALDWMAFRGTFPVSEHPVLERFRSQQNDRASFRSTLPAQ